MSTTTINGRTYAAKENPDGSITLTPLSPIAKGHNPHKLTEAQVGVSEGWRLISEEEQRLAKEPDKSLVELWSEYISAWNSCDTGGKFYHTSTYRTKQPEGFFLPKPERKPEPGDVWRFDDCTIALGTEEGIATEGGVYYTTDSINKLDMTGGTYLGKHHEVYVKKSDVIAALSIKDGCGDSVLHGSSPVSYYAIQKTRKALAKLGITEGGAK